MSRTTVVDTVELIDVEKISRKSRFDPCIFVWFKFPLDFPSQPAASSSPSFHPSKPYPTPQSSLPTPPRCPGSTSTCLSSPPAQASTITSFQSTSLHHQS